jgi:hypothetical protein
MVTIDSELKYCAGLSREDKQHFVNTLQAMNGVELLMGKSDDDDSYSVWGWKDDADPMMMEAMWHAHQDSMFGLYKNDREQFEKDWKDGSFDHGGAMGISDEYVRPIKKVEEEED